MDLVVTDATKSNFISNFQRKLEKKAPENIYKVNFFNKAERLINLQELFINLELISLLKDLPHDFVNSAVVYNLNQAISSSILN